MLIGTLLVVLGVNLIVIVIFAGIVIGRRRWLKRQPGEFAGAVRVAGGKVAFLPPKWKRGSGRWVRDVLVWSKAPFQFRDALVPVDALSGERQAEGGEVKRLGDDPIVIQFVVGDATIEIAARPAQRAQVTGPFAVGSTTGPPTP
jgi:hypothetical protein